MPWIKVGKLKSPLKTKGLSGVTSLIRPRADFKITELVSRCTFAIVAKKRSFLLP